MTTDWSDPTVVSTIVAGVLVAAATVWGGLVGRHSREAQQK